MGTTEAAVFATVRNRVGHLAVNGSLMQIASLSPHLREQLNEWEHSGSVLAVILRLTPIKPGGDEEKAKQRLTEAEAEFAAHIAQYPKPILALLDGELFDTSSWVQQATLRAVTERSTLQFWSLPFLSSSEAPPSLASLPEPLARYLQLIRRPLRPADALYAGLVDYCLPSEMIAEFDHCLDGMSWNTHPREALRTLLATIATRKMPGAELKALRLAIDEHFAFDSLNTIRASLERESRPAYLDWADETLARLDSQCRPASAKPPERPRQSRAGAWRNVAAAAGVPGRR